jgi:hypothetical protein
VAESKDAKGRGVVFRRVNGHVIPIRADKANDPYESEFTKKKNSKLRRGAGAVAAGGVAGYLMHKVAPHITGAKFGILNSVLVGAAIGSTAKWGWGVKTRTGERERWHKKGNRQKDQKKSMSSPGSAQQ